MQRAICYAQICHSRLSMPYANNASPALDRILKLFAESAHHRLRSIRRSTFVIVSQRLRNCKDGGGRWRGNIMVNAPLTSDLIAGALSPR